MKTIKIMITIIVVMTLAINVSATYLLTEYNPPLVLAGQMANIGTQVRYYYNVYDEMDGTAIWVTADGYIGYTATWISAIMPETLYTWSYRLEKDTGNNLTLETGELQKNESQYLALMPGNTFSVIDPAVNRTGNVTVENTINKLPDEYYSMFYDATSRTISYIMYIPQEYYAEHTELFQHSYILQAYGSHVYGQTNRHYINGYSGLQIRGAYTALLGDILTALQGIAGGGSGGLTEEQISAAVEEALIEHEQWQENQGEQIIGEAENTLNEHFGQYFSAADDIRQSLAGISEALSYSGTDGVLVLPEARNPMADNALLWTRKEIDLVAAWNGIPQALRSVVSIVVTMSILTAIAKEVLSILEMWNTEKDLFGR